MTTVNKTAEVRNAITEDKARKDIAWMMELAETLAKPAHNSDCTKPELHVFDFPQYCCHKEIDFEQATGLFLAIKLMRFVSTLNSCPGCLEDGISGRLRKLHPTDKHRKRIVDDFRDVYVLVKLVTLYHNNIDIESDGLDRFWLYDEAIDLIFVMMDFLFLVGFGTKEVSEITGMYFD